MWYTERYQVKEWLKLHTRASHPTSLKQKVNNKTHLVLT